VDIYVTVLTSGKWSPDVNVWVTFTSTGPDAFNTKLGFHPKIDRNLPRTRFGALEAGDYRGTRRWREIIARLYDEGEEYIWIDQRNQEANATWKEGQQINFKLEPWTMENAPRRHAKRPPPTKGTGGSGGPATIR
jgi:hypothetical protein